MLSLASHHQLDLLDFGIPLFTLHDLRPLTYSILNPTPRATTLLPPTNLHRLSSDNNDSFLHTRSPHSRPSLSSPTAPFWPISRLNSSNDRPLHSLIFLCPVPFGGFHGLPLGLSIFPLHDSELSDTGVFPFGISNRSATTWFLFFNTVPDESDFLNEHFLSHCFPRSRTRTRKAL